MPRALLTPDMERRLAGVRFNFTHAMDGRLTGVHRSAQPGVSVEFSDHKEYSPGDDLRRLDWKAYARFDRFYVRQFNKETHANVFLVLDASSSMSFRSGAAQESKLEHAASLAAALAYLFLRQNDAVGLLVVRGDRVTRFLPAASHPSHLVAVREYIEAALSMAEAGAEEEEGPTSLAEGLEFLIARRLSRSAVIVLSDLLIEQEHLFPYLAYLRSGRNFCWLVQVLDPAEFDLDAGHPRTFPFQGSIVFRSPETGQGVMVDSRLARQDYITRFAALLDGLHERCAEAGIDLSACNTGLDPVDFIIRYLLDRRAERE